MFPYLDLAGFQARSLIPASDVQVVEQLEPGFTARRIATWSSWVNARLRKRYGTSTALPFGQGAPSLVAAGALAPPVTLIGRPVLGSMVVRLEMTGAGGVGAAVFRWSSNDGTSWTPGVTTAPTVALGTTGLSAVFPPGSYTTAHSYAAATPVPEAVLGWVTALVQLDVMRKRGVNPQDPMIAQLIEDANVARAEVKEAADSKDALFDLPASEDEGSAVSTGGPLAYTETSPYVWTDVEACDARREDSRGRGTS